MFQRSINIAPAPETVHFTIGNLSAPSLATPNVASATAMAFFGQLHIRYDAKIVVTHMHLIEDGSSPGALVIEVWRRRDGQMTRLTQLSYTAPVGSDFITVGAVPDDPYVQTNDYLFCQAVTGTNLTNGPNGLTVDIHFSF